MIKFKKLKEFPNYLFGDDGNVYTSKDMKLMRPNHSGHYCALSLVSATTGEPVRISRHRAMALAWHGRPPEPDYVAHHINEVPGDDRPDNLEWVSTAKNLYPNKVYAARGGVPSQPVSVRSVSTGDVRHFESISAAARALGLIKESVMYRIRNPGNRVYPDGLQYRHRDDDVPWEAPTIDQFGTLKAVLVKDVLEGVEYQFDSQRTACVHLDVCEAVVSMRLSNADQRLVSGRYLVKLKSDTTPWRDVSDARLENGVATPVVCFVDGTAHIYNTLKQCAEAHGLKTSTLCERLKYPNAKDKVWKDGNRYFYLNDKHDRVPTNEKP